MPQVCSFYFSRFAVGRSVVKTAIDFLNVAVSVVVDGA